MGECIGLKDDIAEIKQDIKDIKADVSEHIRRTAASEGRLEVMETFVQKSLDVQQSNFKDMLQASKDNQAALNRQLKIALGLFAALSVLVGALAAWINVGAPTP
jgi:hypothetical protein